MGDRHRVRGVGLYANGWGGGHRVRGVGLHAHGGEAQGVGLTGVGVEGPQDVRVPNCPLFS